MGPPWVCVGGGGGGDVEWAGRREMHSIPTPSLPRAACLQTMYKALHQLLRLLKFQATSAIPSILNHPDLRLDVGRADLHVSRMVPEAAMVSIQHVQAGLVSLMSAARSGDETAGSQLEGVQQRLKKVRGAGRKGKAFAHDNEHVRRVCVLVYLTVARLQHS